MRYIEVNYVLHEASWKLYETSLNFCTHNEVCIFLRDMNADTRMNLFNELLYSIRVTGFHFRQR